LALNNAFPATASPPEVAAGAAVPVAAAVVVAAGGGVACENEVKENVSINAKQKSIFLEIELWLPTFFI
jgi:shikimate kinase